MVSVSVSPPTDYMFSLFLISSFSIWSSVMYPLTVLKYFISNDHFLGSLTRMHTHIHTKRCSFMWNGSHCFPDLAFHHISPCLSTYCELVSLLQAGKWGLCKTGRVLQNTTPHAMCVPQNAVVLSVLLSSKPKRKVSRMTTVCLTVLMHCPFSQADPGAVASWNFLLFFGAW